MSVTNVLEEILEPIVSKPVWSTGVKTTPTPSQAEGQRQSQTLLLPNEKPEGRKGTTSEEKSIDKCKCLRPFVFKRYNVRIKYVKHMEN